MTDPATALRALLATESEEGMGTAAIGGYSLAVDARNALRREMRPYADALLLRLDRELIHLREAAEAAVTVLDAVNCWDTADTLRAALEATNDH